MVALSEYGYLKTLSLKDRLWPKGDIRLESSKQHSLMSANDPKRTYSDLIVVYRNDTRDTPTHLFIPHTSQYEYSSCS